MKEPGLPEPHSKRVVLTEPKRKQGNVSGSSDVFNGRVTRIGGQGLRKVSILIAWTGHSRFP